MTTDMSTVATSARVATHLHALVGALQDWIDAERAEAEGRVGSVEADDVIADARYGEALDAHAGVVEAVAAWRVCARLGDGGSE